MARKNNVARYQRLNRPQYGRGSKSHGRGRRLPVRWLVLALLIGGLAYLGWRAYTMYTDPVGRNKETVYLLIGRDTTLEHLREQIQTKVWPRHTILLDYLIDKHELERKIRPGRYAVTPTMTTADLVEALVSGPQTPVNLRLGHLRTEAELVKMLDDYLLVTQDELQAALSDSTRLASLGMTREEMRSLFLAGDYQLLWDISAPALLDTMRRHHDRFWTAERRAKADTLGLTTAQVASLAAIVEEESGKRDEYSRIAGLYINRLRKGIKLQSDPTVKFALGDFGLRRILGVHLQVESPYNTYKVAGLTPGPIRLPRPETIDSVLNAEQHDYIYMCARETFDGYHRFAADYATHLRNASLYQQALNERGIK